MEVDLLDELICAAESLTNNNECKNTTITEINIFDKVENEVKNLFGQSKVTENSSVHTGLSDSSDDEDNKYFEEAKYNEYGRTIKQILSSTNGQSPGTETKTSTWNSKPLNSTKQLSLPRAKTQSSGDILIDPVFGIRIIKPLISSKVLLERMEGRESVSFAKLKWYIQKVTPDKDWAIAGVIIQKSMTKTSKKGSQFSIWSLSDLHGDIKTVSVFLFGNAYQELWKTVVGTVVGILNPNILDKKDGSKDEACLSIDNYQKVMILGQSKDLGKCKSMRKTGEPCTAIVNTSQCEYCIYHIKQEYQKYSKRSDMQSSFSGRGLTALRNKVLGKNEVFYAGKSYMAIPATKSKKLMAKDIGRLNSLKSNLAGNSNEISVKSTNKRKAATRLDISFKQRSKDLELLKKLGSNLELNVHPNKKEEFNAGLSREVSLEESRTTALNVINKLKTNKERLKNENVNKKKDFNSELSSGVSLDETKTTSIGVINKQKEDKGYLEDENIIETVSNATFYEENLTLDEIESRTSVGVNNKLKGNISLLDDNVHGSVSQSESNKETLKKDRNKPKRTSLGVINKLKEKKYLKGENIDMAKTVSPLKSNEETLKDKIEPKTTSLGVNNKLKDNMRCLMDEHVDGAESNAEKLKYNKIESKATSFDVINKLKENERSLKDGNMDDIVSTSKSVDRNLKIDEIDFKISDVNDEFGIIQNVKVGHDNLKQNNTKANNSNMNSNLKLNTHNDTKIDIKNGNLSKPNEGNSGKIPENTKNLVNNQNMHKDRSFLNPFVTFPSISNNGKNTVDLSAPISRMLVDKAKLNAVKYIQKNGPIKKSNPMNTRGTGKKRISDRSTTDEIAENDPKKQKIQQNGFFSDRFKKIMAMQSQNAHLIEAVDNEEQEKYFKKLEIREKMEEKMAGTYKLQCKAVRCLKCKYTSFSASDMCKAEKHPLKVFDTFKRFFKCGDCGNRIVCLELVPLLGCKNCGSGKWERTSMMKEKNVKSLHHLSIRGGEQKFMNSVSTDANLDLLVPTE